MTIGTIFGNNDHSNEKSRCKSKNNVFRGIKGGGRGQFPGANVRYMRLLKLEVVRGGAGAGRGRPAPRHGAGRRGRGRRRRRARQKAGRRSGAAPALLCSAACAELQCATAPLLRRVLRRCSAALSVPPHSIQY